jgi:hypothetical protein
MSEFGFRAPFPESSLDRFNLDQDRFLDLSRLCVILLGVEGLLSHDAR